jgi:hypothetical protein
MHCENFGFDSIFVLDEIVHTENFGLDSFLVALFVEFSVKN